ncbi:Bacterial SH3 domain protein [Symmachiella dynata]|uniref:SH3 domain-containing protein n=1 Tax=Symmachiella dynata TaxID=2527995 RepID=UPI00118A9102|nr:SH3 domain-containing protein [Symmachiella dynata]QDT47721.1 Bacterial SH3 domain protein [Symmachiella dynata]
MRLTLAAIIIATLFPAMLCAQEQRTPYEAEIHADDVFVRSGNSRSHYPTGKLGQGDRVTVHRRELGGWLMISPPKGSFDWVAADTVQIVQQPRANQPARGVIRAERTVARIGSGLEPDRRDNWHVMLTRGKRVTILGEKVFDTPEGPQRWYKIEPPADDHRWILGQFVQSVEQGAGRTDPFEANNGDLSPPDIEKQRKRKRAQRMLAEQQKGAGYDDTAPADRGGLKERKMVRIDSAPKKTTDVADAGGARTGPTLAELEDDRMRMKRLDGVFNNIVRSKTSQWDFRRLEQDYQNLQRSAADNAVRRQVDLRLRKVAQYKKIKAEHDEFVRLTRESDEREARILSMRSQPAARPVKQEQQRRFSGAGIVQRSIGAPRGAPVHALVAPDGRVLAYLQGAKGVNLDRYLGRAVGINGPRTHQPKWNTDHILVEKLTPVNLKQP